MKRALRSVWEFVVGEEPLAAVLVAAGLGLTAVIAGAGADPWWVMPPAVLAALALAVGRGTR